MKLCQLHLTHFKNYASLELDLEQVNTLILVGDNGHGKTNLLESVVVLALSKSFSARPLKSMINWDLDEATTGLPELFRIHGEIESQGKRHQIEVMSGKTQKYPKTLKRDDIKVKASEYVGTFRVVVFTPQDLNMILLAPQLRRRYIDIFISQIDPQYLEHLSQYQVYLKQRNSLLSRIKERQASEQELDYWDEAITRHGAYVLWKRRKIFDQLNQTLSKHYLSLSQQENDLQVLWKKDWDCEELADTTRSFEGYLKEKRRRDIDAESTCGGPHREDFSFRMREMSLADFGSRGECRSAVLSLKLAECDVMKQDTGESPVVLFDDVFSELDVHRQQQLLQLFHEQQVIITTTHLDYEIEHATVMKVEQGKLTTLTQA